MFSGDGLFGMDSLLGDTLTNLSDLRERSQDCHDIAQSCAPSGTLRLSGEIFAGAPHRVADERAAEVDVLVS